MSMLKYFKFPFATLGDKTAIPDASQPSGSVSYTDGFTVDYELDPGVDPAAKDVPRDETNQLYFDITNAIKEYQEFGTPDYITSALNGGAAFSYAKNARVKWTDGFVYESRVAANTSTPADLTKWRKLTENMDFLAIATTAFEASVADGEAVYWDVTNSRFDEAVADGTTKQNVIGIADVTNSRVFINGLVPGFSGLTGNVKYYLSGVTPGALTSVLPTSNIVIVGIAKDADEMFIDIIPQPAVAAATESVAGIAEIATQAETNTGTDDARFVTPLKLANATTRGLGLGQTWQNVTASRAINTTYTNSTTKPISIRVTISQAAVNSATVISLVVDGVTISTEQASGNAASGETVVIQEIIPPGSTYRIPTPTGSAGGTLSTWYELR